MGVTSRVVRGSDEDLLNHGQDVHSIPGEHLGHKACRPEVTSGLRRRNLPGMGSADRGGDHRIGEERQSASIAPVITRWFADHGDPQSLMGPVVEFRTASEDAAPTVVRQLVRVDHAVGRCARCHVRAVLITLERGRQVKHIVVILPGDHPAGHERSPVT